MLSGHERIHLLNPIEYPDMINLLSRSFLILSDSGGGQASKRIIHIIAHHFGLTKKTMK